MTIDPIASRLSSEGVRFAQQIAGAARKHGLDPQLLAAVAAQETGGPGSNAGSNVVGDGGHGRGVFQIDDRWHDFAKTADAMNPEKNADYAAGMLSGLLHRFGGNVHQALSAYNAGDPNAVGTRTRWAGGKTLGYADSVLEHYRQLTGSRAPAQSDDAPVEPQAPVAADTAEPADLSELLQALQTMAAGETGTTSQPPTPPQPQQQPQSYQRQMTDYSSIFDDDSD